MENTRTASLILKAVEFCRTSDYISGKVGKPRFLESPQTSLKTRQHLYQ